MRRSIKFFIIGLIFIFQTVNAQIQDRSTQEMLQGMPFKYSEPFTPVQFDTAADFNVLHYRLDFSFPLETSTYSGRATLSIRSMAEGLETIELDMVGLTADSVLYHDEPADFSQTESMIQIHLNPPVGLGDTVQVSVVYQGEPGHGGFYVNDRTAYTYSEPVAARQWYPCHDVPWDKATAELFVTVPVGYEVASIGLLENRSLSEDGLRETFHWKTSYQIATYLIAVTMSEYYARWSDWYVMDDDSIELSYYVYTWDSTDAVYDFGNMVEAMAFFSERFGPYPFEKYGMVEVDRFVVGGMEHQTMSSINSSWITGSRLVENGMVHELSHMWWGDAVTLNDWPAIWLNEGFATYSEALFFEYKYGRDSLKYKMELSKNYYFTQAEAYDFPIYNPPEGELFNWGIVYNKGALVLHMLRHVIGDSCFWNVLQTYFQTYQYGNASIDEFQNIAETLSGISLDWFFNQWIYSAGYPVVLYAWYIESGTQDACSLALGFQQTGDRVFQWPLDVRIQNANTYLDTTLWIRHEEEIFSLELQFKPDSIVLDPQKWSLFKYSWKQEGRREGEGYPGLKLYPNFPNPFHGSTMIYYEIPEKEKGQRIRLIVFNLQGRQVRTLIDSRKNGGHYWAVWNGDNGQGIKVASGLYLLGLYTEEDAIFHKVIVVN